MTRTPHTPSPEIEKLMDRAISEGQRGRADLVQQLKGLPLETLLRHHRRELNLLGSTGIVELVRARTALASGDGEVEPETATTDVTDGNTERPQPAAPPRAMNRFVAAAILAVTMTVGGAVADHGWSSARSHIDSGLVSRDVSVWPTCSRLDRWVDACVYRTGGGSTLTLERAAELLAIPVDLLQSANVDLAIPPTTTLPPRTKLVVWRGHRQLMEVRS
jgi:hypothetical protein